MIQLSDPYMTNGKTRAFTRWTFVHKITSLLFNMSRLVIAFLPRSKCLLISWLQSPYLQWFWNPKENKVSHGFHCFPIYLTWSDETRCWEGNEVIFFHCPDCPFTFLIVSFDAQMFVGGFCFIFRFWWKKICSCSSSDISKKPWSNPRSWSFVLIFVSLSFIFSPLKFRILTHTDLIIGYGVKTCLKSFFGIWIASFLSIIC